MLHSIHWRVHCYQDPDLRFFCFKCADNGSFESVDCVAYVGSVSGLPGVDKNFWGGEVSS